MFSQKQSFKSIGITKECCKYKPFKIKPNRLLNIYLKKFIHIFLLITITINSCKKHSKGLGVTKISYQKSLCFHLLKKKAKQYDYHFYK